MYTSYLFSDSDNIDELYDGMKKILKNLRFEWAEFKVTKYSKSTARYIGGKEDHVIDWLYWYNLFLVDVVWDSEQQVWLHAPFHD